MPRPTIVNNIVVSVAAAVLVFLVWYYAALLVAHRGNPDFLAIDSCLDDGGSWDYGRRLCDAARSWDPLKTSGLASPPTGVSQAPETRNCVAMVPGASIGPTRPFRT